MTLPVRRSTYATGSSHHPESISSLEYADFGARARVPKTRRIEAVSPEIAVELRNLLGARGTSSEVDTSITDLAVLIHSLEYETPRGHEPEARRIAGSPYVRIVFSLTGDPVLVLLEIGWEFLCLAHALDTPRLLAAATFTLTHCADRVTRPFLSFQAART
jgi:hypothetical protein